MKLPARTASAGRAAEPVQRVYHQRFYTTAMKGTRNIAFVALYTIFLIYFCNVIQATAWSVHDGLNIFHRFLYFIFKSMLRLNAEPFGSAENKEICGCCYFLPGLARDQAAFLLFILCLLLLEMNHFSH